MDEANIFKWIDFYTAFATKLLEYKDDRQALIGKIRKTYESIGISLPTLDKNNHITDIDPFTVFGLFNKGITDQNRIAIIQGLISEFSVNAAVPDDFFGIPVLNPMKATFYRFEDERQEQDIDNLWAVFEAAIDFSAEENEDNRKRFCAAYDQALSQYAVKWNLTMGLYWIRPNAYLNLDSRNREFLSKSENAPSNIAAEIKPTMSVPSAEKYLELRDKCRDALFSGTYDYKSFPELSYKAWKVSTQPPVPPEAEEPNNISIPNKNSWLISWNPSIWEWPDYDQICAQTTPEHTFIDSWPSTNKMRKIGDEVFLTKNGNQPRGIIGHGTVCRENYEAENNDDGKAEDGTKYRIDVKFDRLLNYKNEKILSQDELIEKWPTQTWSPHSFGIEIKQEVLPTLHLLWNDIINGEDDWWPKLSEYDPGITEEQYREYFDNESVIKRTWLEALYDLYRMPGHLGTCKQLELRYGNSAQSYNRYLTAAAANILKASGCPAPPEDENSKYWPVLFQGRAPKNRSEGNYCWKMRDPVQKAIAELFDGDIPDMVNNEQKEQYEHNMILYGPPGTGKTYNAVNYAVAICESRQVEDIQNEDYQDVLVRFNHLKEEGRIAFTTFHQSCGYEEFIEGISPKTNPEDASKLEYEIRDGLFKAFCKRAQAVKVQSATGVQMKDQPRIWGMILGGTGMTELKKQCFANNEIRLGWTEVKDEDVEGDFIGDEQSSWNAKHMVFDFKNSMEVGDIVVIEKNNKSIDAIGVITGEYVYDESHERYPRSRSVEWLVKDIDQDMVPFLPNGRKQLSRFSVFAFDYIGMDVISQIINEHTAESVVDVEQETKPYVFIIDEINRGNISKIFGELITLIEDTKRAGASEAMEARLPYSGELFSVPQNVCILGTMNTADRSIALMDTALRRRFDFVEMMPNTEILKGVVVEDQDAGVTVEIDKMLDAINKRIEILYDREHMIGHAYFMKLKDDNTLENLKEIFLNRIIPLLQEYFYDDYERIQLVLGDNDKEDAYKFIEDKDVKFREFFKGQPVDDVYDEKKIYRINKEAFDEIISYLKIYA